MLVGVLSFSCLCMIRGLNVIVYQGETFEYVRLDKQYRYFSEQVSHHPPISACYAQSPRWHYYGEVCPFLLENNEQYLD